MFGSVFIAFIKEKIFKGPYLTISVYIIHSFLNYNMEIMLNAFMFIQSYMFNN